MLFEKEEPLELQPRRTRTLLISIGIHLFLLGFLALNPEFLTSTPKRIIRVLTQDYDLKQQLVELVPPPDVRPKPAAPPQHPLVQPPAPSQPEPQVAPPPPSPPPPPPPPPDR